MMNQSRELTLVTSWRKIKKDFLNHFSNPRVDLLVWILLEKLAPQYYRRIDRILHPIPRYRERASWRKAFKKEWKRCIKTPIRGDVDDKYRPDAHRWVCSCGNFVRSRFLLCKHLAQAVHPVPPVFFWEVKRRRSQPFWSHPALVPLGPPPKSLHSSPCTNDEDVQRPRADSDMEIDSDSDSESVSSGDEGSLPFIAIGKTCQEQMLERVELLEEFVRGLRYQIQFNDVRMLNIVEREGGSLFRLARSCLDREKRFNSTRTDAPTTYDRQTSNAMFWRTRPLLRNE